VNTKGKVMEVYQKKDIEGQPAWTGSNNGQKYQKWSVVYLDKKSRTRTSGMNKNRNLEINRPFYIVSDLLFNRVASLYSGNRIVI
jgi:purine nucleoside permease